MVFENYKCFHKRTEIVLASGLNLIVGQNNSGKTSLLQILSGNALSNPHRSPLTISSEGATPDPTLKAGFDFEITANEAVTILAEQREFMVAEAGGVPQQQLLRDVFESTTLLQISITYTSRDNGRTFEAVVPGAGIYKPRDTGDNTRFLFFKAKSEGGRVAVTDAVSSNSSAASDFTFSLGQKLVTRAYRFKPERFAVGECPFGNRTMLADW